MKYQLCLALILPGFAAGVAYAREAPAMPLRGEAKARLIALNYIKRHRAQFGLGPEDKPEFDKSRLADSGPTDPELVMRILFKPQVHQGIVVEGTDIEVIVSVFDRRVLASGSRWIQGITASAQPSLTAEQARQSLIGKELTDSDMGGRPRQVKMTADDVEHANPELVFTQGEASKEVRLAWKVRVAGPWDVFVDARSGAILKVYPLFFH